MQERKKDFELNLGLLNNYDNKLIFPATNVSQTKKICRIGELIQITKWLMLTLKNSMSLLLNSFCSIKSRNLSIRKKRAFFLTTTTSLIVCVNSFFCSKSPLRLRTISVTDSEIVSRLLTPATISVLVDTDCTTTFSVFVLELVNTFCGLRGTMLASVKLVTGAALDTIGDVLVDTWDKLFSEFKLSLVSFFTHLNPIGVNCLRTGFSAGSSLFASGLSTVMLRKHFLLLTGVLIDRVLVWLVGVSDRLKFGLAKVLLVVEVLDSLPSSVAGLRSFSFFCCFNWIQAVKSLRNGSSCFSLGCRKGGLLASSSVSSLILIGENLISGLGSGLGDLDEASVISGPDSFFGSARGEISSVLVKMIKKEFRVNDTNYDESIQFGQYSDFVYLLFTGLDSRLVQRVLAPALLEKKIFLKDRVPFNQLKLVIENSKKYSIRQKK
ncbi:hypothetical protein BpHYR1_054133 [Brachionus plicatilis]|uniref:Uncharacterized protein n=1 Tax=Brachionus plicatilis TaxID=10195 RepID=A0A3M7S968_BRAPC|nr:hypothetical protein BpHYR1_054133 [Brachionus plicatilis]